MSFGKRMGTVGRCVLIVGALGVGAATIAAARAEGGERSAAGKATPGPTMADFNKLQTEVREQRQLIVEMLQSEQQRYEMLLKLIRAQSGGPLPELPRATASAPVPGATAVDAPAVPATPTDAATANRRGGPQAAEHQKHGGTVAGRVGVTGGDVSDVYVYIDNIKGAPVRGKTVEIRQENKQFSPRVAVVQAGTSLIFPNFDSVYHNVFSNSPRNSFDLGSSRSGDSPRPVTLTKPGVVEVFCNMHQKMSASVLVVPSPLYAKVRADGTFRIENVPLGARKAVAWSPHATSVEQQVDVTASGAEVIFAMQAQGDDRKAHLNKTGQAYGSYRE